MITTSNDKHLVSIPGIFYGGGCSYMACSGCAVGSIRDALLITHGPTGCRYYSGINSMRNRGLEPRTEAYRGRIFSTNLEEEDIIFGGEDKLSDAIDEAVGLFHPTHIIICSTCPVGLIGDDMQRVASLAAKRHGISILPISCEGYEPEPGWLTGTRELMNNWVGTTTAEVGRFPVHFMSESYAAMGKEVIGGMLGKIGYDVVCSMMGESTCDEICHAQQARLIVLDSGKEIDEIPTELSRRYGAGFFRVSFTGIANIDDSLRRMAAFFGDKDLTERTEAFIESEHARIAPQLEECRQSLSGITAAIFEDIFRSDAYAALSDELGMDVILVAQDFTATTLRDDGFTVRVSETDFEKLCDADELFRTKIAKPEHVPGESGTAGTAGHLDKTPEAESGRVRLQLDRGEVAEALQILKPELCFAGIEEQFSYHGGTIRSEQFTSDDRGTAYFGYDGIFRYAADVEMARFMSHWVTEPPAWAAEDSGRRG